MNAINDTFEQIRRIQEQINKWQASLRYQSQFNGFYKNTNLMKQYQQQFELISKAQTFFSEQSRLFQKSLNPYLKLIAYQQEVLRQTQRVPETLIQRMSEWQSTIEKINYPAILGAEIPREIYASLSGLTCELDGRIDTSADFSDDLTVGANARSEINGLTWNELLMILLMFLSIIVPYYTNHMNNVHQDISNKELISELRHQTELQEQILKTEKARLIIDQELTVKQKDLEDMFDVLMKSIKPLIPENLNISEADQ